MNVCLFSHLLAVISYIKAFLKALFASLSVISLMLSNASWRLLKPISLFLNIFTSVFISSFLLILLIIITLLSLFLSWGSKWLNKHTFTLFIKSVSVLPLPRFFAVVSSFHDYSFFRTAVIFDYRLLTASTLSLLALKIFKCWVLSILCFLSNFKYCTVQIFSFSMCWYI